jgi:hypothetical protein
LIENKILIYNIDMTEKYLSDKDMNQVLDDLTAYGILQKRDAEGNKQEVKLTKARKKRVEASLDLAPIAVTSALMFQLYKDGTLQKILDEVKKGKSE